MRSRSHPVRLALAVGLAATVGVGSGAVAPPVGAAPSVTGEGTVVTVVADAPGGITLLCSGGFVRSLGTTTSVPCASLTEVRITGSDGSDVVYGNGMTPDTFPALGVVDLDLGAGADAYLGGPVTAVGDLGPGNDQVTGGTGIEELDGGADGDNLQSGGGADVLRGGPGNDYLAGGAGPDDLTGGPGRDTIDGGEDSDVVRATLGDLPDDGSVGTGGSGADSWTDTLRLTGDAGRETVVARPAAGGSTEVVWAGPLRAQVLSLPPTFEQVVIDVGAGDDHVAVRMLPLTTLTLPDAAGADGLDVQGPDGVSGTTTITAPGVAPVVAGAGWSALRVRGPWSTLDRAFAHDAARELLGAVPTPESVVAQATAIGAGSTTRSTIASDHVGTATWRGYEIDRIFQGYLGRSLDAAGRTFWVGEIAKGQSLFLLRVRIVASVEYLTRSGGTNASFVTAVYRDVLGRAPDAAGLAYWVGRLDGGALRSDLTRSLLGSAEAVKAQTTHPFRRLIGRDPTPAELGTWGPRVRSLATGEQDLTVFLVSSATFRTRAF